MSTHADAEHHAPEAPERSSTLLWTFGLLVIMVILVAWFAHWFKRGAHEGRHLGPYPKVAAAVAVDHTKLIAERGQEVLDKGATIYAKTCAACHGAAGVPSASIQPPPRNFTTEAVKNPNGNGPYALYLVLLNGFEGRMPAQPGLTAEEKYAVIHFLREGWIKANKAAKYVEVDPPKVTEMIPKPGTTTGPPPPPWTVQEPAAVRALMAGFAAEAAGDRAQAEAWLERIIASRPSALVVTAVRELRASERFQFIAQLHQAAKAGQKDRFTALLVGSESGGWLPWFALRSQADLDAIFAPMQQAAATAPAAAGVK